MKLPLLSCLCLTFLLIGCSSYQKLEVPTAQSTAPLPLKVGDTIRYRVNQGPLLESRIITLNHHQFTDSQGKTVLLSHISDLEKKNISTGKTTMAIGASGLVAITVIVGLAAAGLAAAIVGG
ncbi:hypothetical protein EC835_1203 [Providencia alcalifaciens]|uniref:Lipoprotein n=1 Tax=Providencia alcalifaciens TaxID=126385 RepID=A0A4R3NIM5_9GAMM|nr:hypothetical protein EC835_1203 [Providencia alcalifaciens]